MEQEFEIKEEGFNYTALFVKILDYWYIFAISVVLALVGGYFYNKFTTPVYEVNTTIMIENESPSFSSERVLEDMGLFSQNRNILNEKVILQSYDIVYETLKQLDFTIFYFSDDGYILTELYKNSPFIVKLDSLSSQLVNTFFELDFISENKFRLSAKTEDVRLYSYQKKEYTGKQIGDIDFSEVFSFGDQIITPYFSFKVDENLINEAIPCKSGDKYKFIFNNLNELTMGYKKKLKIDLFERDVDIFTLSIESNNILKSIDFLNRLTSVYISKKLEKKNTIANNTIRFIDNQLFSITDSLTDAENRLQNFRSSSKMMDVNFQTEELFGRLSALDRDKSVLISQRKYFDYALKTIKEGTNLDDIMIPSTIGISDVTLNTLIAELIDLSSRKMALSSNTLEKSQAIMNLEVRIENTKKLIINNLNSLIEVTELSLRNLESQISAIEAEVKKLPATQQKLLGYERQFTLNNEIYNFLMQKRAEAQIAKASNTPDSEVIDLARPDVYKKKSASFLQIMAIALILGIFIPGLGIFLSMVFKDTIMMRQDIEDIAKIPIVGSIIYTKHDSTKVFVERPNSPISESFRSLYTNLQYLTKGKEHQVILITSSLQGEGKTFNAINIACVFASFGKKTCLLSFDLRRAKADKAFDLLPETGLSTYLINFNKMEDIIVPSGIENLDIIPTGPIPPNPVELIASKQTEVLFSTIRAKYDCVIIDSPPLAVVTDALLLMKYSDINIIIARQNFTRKKILSAVVKELDNNEIRNVSILFNGLKQSRVIGYGYSYGYGYYKSENKSWLKQWLKKLAKWRGAIHTTGT